MERTIGVFGEEVLLWICMLHQSPRRPPADHLHRQASLLLNELKQSRMAMELPVVSVDDGMFAIAALLDEIAMSLPDMRPTWAAAPLQATRWGTNNAGVEFFERLGRVRQGPKAVLATYVAVLGIGFQGRFALPGADRYALAQLRRQLSMEIGIDPDRDRQGGVLVAARPDAGPSSLLPKDPWWRSVWLGQLLSLATLVGGALALALILYERFG